MQSKREKAIHFGHKCDQCGQDPIRGPRYKCLECPSYDLCSHCLSHRREFHNPRHSFIEYDVAQKKDKKVKKNKKDKKDTKDKKDKKGKKGKMDEKDKDLMNKDMIIKNKKFKKGKVDKKDKKDKKVKKDKDKVKGSLKDKMDKKKLNPVIERLGGMSVMETGEKKSIKKKDDWRKDSVKENSRADKQDYKDEVTKAKGHLKQDKKFSKDDKDVVKKAKAHLKKDKKFSKDGKDVVKKAKAHLKKDKKFSKDDKDLLKKAKKHLKKEPKKKKQKH